MCRGELHGQLVADVDGGLENHPCTVVVLWVEETNLDVPAIGIDPTVWAFHRADGVEGVEVGRVAIDNLAGQEAPPDSLGDHERIGGHKVDRPIRRSGA